MKGVGLAEVTKTKEWDTVDKPDIRIRPSLGEIEEAVEEIERDGIDNTEMWGEQHMNEWENLKNQCIRFSEVPSVAHSHSRHLPMLNRLSHSCEKHSLCTNYLEPIGNPKGEDKTIFYSNKPRVDLTVILRENSSVSLFQEIHNAFSLLLRQ